MNLRSPSMSCSFARGLAYIGFGANQIVPQNRFLDTTNRRDSVTHGQMRTLVASCILKEMAQNFIERLKHSPVLCDGAMGTLLYAKGIFINRCYDELNLLQPELIRGVHHDYLQAGAEMVETNTFGGNSFRLARHSLADRVREINVAGAHVAREAAKSFGAWVAGSIGPLGVRIEPLGKTSFEEARTAFREQVAALVEGGVDLLMLETFGYLEELHQAVLACRDVNAKIPLVAQVTIDEDGNCLDGSDPEAFAARLTEWN